jgi:hypothetical protein
VEALEGFAQWLTDEVRRQRSGVEPPWNELAIRELPRLPSVRPTLNRRRHRLDLVFTVGPLSNEYPTTAARSLLDEIPRRVELAFAADVLDGRGHAYVVGAPRRAESVDDDGHVTLTVIVGATLEVRA